MNVEKGLNKRKFLLGLFGAIIISGLIFVLAVGNPILTNPVTNTNYSGTLSFNCTANMDAAVNATLYYSINDMVNSTNGTALSTVVNTSANETVFGVYVDFSSLSDSIYYNFSCLMVNISNSQVWSAAVDNVTIDNTAPNVSSFYTTVNYGNYSTDTLELNVSVADGISVIDTVYFNISNETFSNFSAAVNAGGNYYNWTWVNITTNWSDGDYNITVYANESDLLDQTGAVTTNTNNTEKIIITLDFTAPTIASFACSPSSVLQGQEVTCACSGDDGLGSGVKNTTVGTLTTDAAYKQITAETTNTGTYTVNCTVVDNVNKMYSTTTTYTVTSAGGSSSGGTTTTSSWKTVGFPTEAEFQNGYTKQLKLNNRMKVKIRNEYHYVGVKELTSTSATIEIASDPVEIKLDIGEDAKLDVDGDGVYDLYVILNSITGTQADVTIQELNEAIPEGGESVSTTGEVQGEGSEVGEDEQGTDGEGSGNWMWIIIIILILAAAAGGVAAKKKK